MMNHKRKISFCTVCMNRSEHLKITLEKNIKDNISYGNLEFVVLDYNSTDGLEDWIFSSMGEYLEKGILKYIKTEEPKYFLRSHSKNIASIHATGEIVCNVDADNFIGLQFADYINECFSKNENVFLSADQILSDKGCIGRICLKKEDFIEVRGYDESMRDYGFEDNDLINRLEMKGLIQHNIPLKYMNSIAHEDVKRVENEYNTKEIKTIYLKNETHYATTCAFHFKNNMIYLGVIINYYTQFSYSVKNLFRERENFEYGIKDGKWEKGAYIGSNRIELNNGGIIDLKSSNFHEVKDSTVDELMFFFSQVNNRMIMNNNINNKTVAVNKNSFGRVTLKKF